MDKIICEIVIPDFITKIEFSKSRRAKYFERGKTKIANKYLNNIGTKYNWVKKGSKHILYDISTNQPVIANPKAVGTPNIKPIKGNDFYSGFSTPQQRIKIVETIKSSFTKEFNKTKSFNDYPLFVEFIYFDVMNFTNTKTGKKTQDIDNLRFAYEKCSLDLLKRLKKITDDDLRYVRKLSSEFIEVQPNERKLIVAFYNYIPSRNSDGSIINKKIIL